MPRLARFRLTGYPLHIVQRGHNRAPCFFQRTDYERYLHWLAEAASEHHCAVHAYVLMTNHVHILLTEQEDQAVTALMRAVNQRYVQCVNKMYGRTGSLWQGRFHSSIVDTDRYLLTVHRYIELNPVRAGLARNPADYPWSSHGHYALLRPSSFLQPHPMHAALGSDDLARAANYAALFADPPSSNEIARIRDAANSSRPLGSEAFLERMQENFGVPAMPAVRGRPRRKDAIPVPEGNGVRPCF